MKPRGRWIYRVCLQGYRFRAEFCQGIEHPGPIGNGARG